MAESPTFSLVLPIYNEEAVLPLLLPRIDALLIALDGPAEVIFVDDGSRDLSGFILEQRSRQDMRYKLISLSRNFGHQVAVSAGLDAAAGAAVIVMDADLQDPPEVTLDLVAKWREGFDVVSAKRVSREADSRFKRLSAALFYRFIGRLSSVDIPAEIGDFRLVDRKVVDAFKAMPERDRFVRGMFAWLGFRQAVVTFHRAGRAAGQSKYPLLKMFRLAANGVLSFSEVPLTLAFWSGSIVTGLAVLYSLYVLAMWLIGAPLVRGWSSIVLVVAFLGGANMMMTGIIGLYVARIHAEVKRRPLYVVGNRIGFDVVETASGYPAGELLPLRRRHA